MNFLFLFVNITVNLLEFAIIIRVLLSWFSGSPGRFSHWIHEVTEPIMRLTRRIPHRMGLIDLSPIIALLGLDLLRYLIFRILNIL